jgi:hypothetical protein
MPHLLAAKIIDLLAWLLDFGDYVERAVEKFRPLSLPMANRQLSGSVPIVRETRVKRK